MCPVLVAAKLPKAKPPSFTSVQDDPLSPLSFNVQISVEDFLPRSKLSHKAHVSGRIAEAGNGLCLVANIKRDIHVAVS